MLLFCFDDIIFMVTAVDILILMVAIVIVIVGCVGNNVDIHITIGIAVCIFVMAWPFLDMLCIAYACGWVISIKIDSNSAFAARFIWDHWFDRCGWHCWGAHRRFIDLNLWYCSEKVQRNVEWVPCILAIVCNVTHFVIENIRMLPSAQPDINFVPIAFHVILVIVLECSFSSINCELDAKSKIRTFGSSPAAAKYLPSGLKLTLCTGKRHSVNTRNNFPLVISHSRTLWSDEPVAR